MNAFNWKVWLAAFVLFLAGMAAGSILTVGIGTRLLRTAFNGNPQANANGLAQAERLNRVQYLLVRELDLDTVQAAQVQFQLDQMKAELRRARVANAQQAQGIMRDTLVRIGADLPPEKREKLQSLTEKLRRRFGFGGERPAREKPEPRKDRRAAPP